MSRKWIEQIKSIVLTFLILLSFVLTGYLIFSAPSFEESSSGYLRPPYIGEEKNNQQSVFQIAAPFQLIVRKQGDHYLSLPHDSQFDQLYQLIREAELTNFSEIKPTYKQWELIYQKSMGVELHFLHDTSIGHLDSFFKRTVLRDQPFIKDQKQISRILFSIDPKTEKIWTWFISDETQTVIQALTHQIDVRRLEQQLYSISLKSKYAIVPHPTNEKPPWNKENQNVPFSRMIYLPKHSFAIDALTYNLQQIDIEHMKQWLFPDPSVTPIQVNNIEFLYMYSDSNMQNDQIITYNKQKNTMVYTNAPTHTEKQTMLIREELNEINQFIQRHRGWTNTYLLDQIKTDDHANEYIFRLFVNQLPVYWKSSNDSNIVHPDTIRFQVKSGSINKYTRSLFFLSKDQHEQTEVTLPNQQQLFAWLKQKKIDSTQIKRLFPSYFAVLDEQQRIQLTPAWRIETNNGKTYNFPASTKEENG